MRQRCFSCVEAVFSCLESEVFRAFVSKCKYKNLFSFRNGFYFQISCPGFNFVSDFSAWGGILPERGRGAWSRVQIAGFLPLSSLYFIVTGADRVFLSPSAFMYVVPNCGKGPLSSGCLASGIPQGRHLQMPGRSWRAGKAVWRWKARRP